MCLGSMEIDEKTSAMVTLAVFNTREHVASAMVF